MSTPSTGLRRPQRRPLFLVGGMVLLVALTVWRFYIAEPPARLLNFSGHTMGTTFHVKVVADSRSQQSDATRAHLVEVIDGALNGVDAAMSSYRPQSELSRFNDGAANVDFSLSADTATVVALSLELARLSGGAFDPTVGPLVDRWGFGPDKGITALPSDAELAALSSQVGYEHLTLDGSAATLRKNTEDLHLDLSAVAKGFAVDKVGEALELAGFDAYMVEVGGELHVSGATELGRPWRLAIETPDSETREIYEVLSLKDRSMATSGNYRNFAEIGGVRYSHTIDPRTARPVTHSLASVTVVDRTCARADALATTLSVLGPEQGAQFARTHDIAALFLVVEDDSLTEFVTPAFKALRSASQ